DAYNLVATVGSFVLGLGTLVLLVNFVYSLFRGAPAGANPWDADTLEWSMPSPPPIFAFYQFPIVHDRHPLWTTAPPSTGGDYASLQAALAGEPTEWRATLATDALLATPQAVQRLASSTYLPFWAAV